MTQAPIFLDHHATTPVLPAVTAAMHPYWRCVLPRHQANALLETAQETIAHLIGAPLDSLTFTSGATEANNIALTGVAKAAAGEARTEILVTAIEHDSILQQADVLRTMGFTLRQIPVTAAGYADPAVIGSMISDKTLLVSVMWANHEIGTVQPIAEIARRAKSAGAWMHSDATQAVGKVSLNVTDAGVDMLSFSAHKMGGPQGIGALYVRPAPPVPMMRILQGGAQQRYRAGSLPLPLVAGFAKAAEEMQKNAAEMAAHCAACVRAFLYVLDTRGIAYERNGGQEARLAGSLNIRFTNTAADDLLLHFAKDMIFSSGAACRNGAPSAVLSALGLSPAEISRSIRLCFGHGNTLAQAQSAADKIADFIEGKV